jgi:hypothetical protein
LASYLSTGSGWSETVPSNAIDLPDLWERVLHEADLIGRRSSAIRATDQDEPQTAM